MRKIAYKLALFVVGIYASLSFANENLWSIYQKAIERDPTFMQQQFTYEADKESIEQAKGLLRPQINATLGTGRINDDVDAAFESASGEESYNNNNAAITLSQTIWDKSRFENLELAKNQVYLSKLQLDNTRQDLYLRISDSYFDLLAAQVALEVTEQQRQTLQEQFDQASELLEAGLGTSTDYFESQSRYQLAKVDILTAKNLIADNRQALKEIIGEPVQVLAKPPEDYPITDPDPVELDTWIQTAFRHNYELAAAHQQADIARQNIEIARSGYWPSVNLNALQSYNDNDDGISGGIDSNERVISLDLSAPIYQGGQIKSQTREASQRYTASLKNIDTVSRNIERRIRDAYNTVITTKNQITALISAVKAARNALEARQESFDSGLSTNLEVLDATSDLFSARLDLLQARYNYITSTFRLKSLAGILSDADFKQTSNLLVQ